MTTRQGFWTRVAMAVIAVLCVAWCLHMYQQRLDRREPLWRADATVWTRVPVRVYFDAHDFESYSDVIVAAMGLWNSAAGCELLVRTKDQGEADVTIRELGAVPCGSSFEGDRAPMWTCYGPSSAIIETRALGETSGELLRFEHEDGHLLGLDHRHDGSIMEPVINDPQPGEAPPAALISGFLADKVRDRWCR